MCGLGLCPTDELAEGMEVTLGSRYQLAVHVWLLRGLD